MIQYGRDDNDFYIEFKSKSREVGNIRQEFEIRARQLYEEKDNIVLGISGGLDSQVMMHSFLCQGLNVNTSFLYMPGYNDNEYKCIKILDEKYKIKTDIVSINPLDYYDELKSKSIEYDILSPYTLLHGIYSSFFPIDAVFIQAQGPSLYHNIFTNKTTKETVFQTSYYEDTVSRRRAFDMYERKNNSLLWADFSEHLLSLMNDDIFITALCISDYWTDNKSQQSFETRKGIIKRDTSYDKYIKPFIFGKYWKNELLYFPKDTGFNILIHEFKDFGLDMVVEDNQYSFTYHDKIKKNSVLIPINELYNLLNSNKNISEKYYLGNKK
jgi:hypothetical protein